MSAQLLAGLFGAALVVGLLAWFLHREPRAFALLAIFALPFRLPISVENRTVNLLIPLYLVVAAGALARLMPVLSSRVHGRSHDQDGHDRWHGRLEQSWPRQASPRRGARTLAWWLSPRGLEWLLLAAVALYALQGLYSSDAAKAAENLAFFYVPFGVLFLLLSDISWTRGLVLACLAVAVALAVAFAGVGFVEYARKALFLNPKLVAANQYDNYFRVNSLFFDPNIYGRFLALVMIAVMSGVLWSARRRLVLLGAVVLAWLLAGLITSFSQSSIAALLLGLAVLAAYRWQLRRTLYAAVGLVAIAGVILLAAPASFHFGLKGESGSASNATSGRTQLISGGLRLFAHQPLAGYGSGSFETEYKRHEQTNVENAASASHTIPVTIAAEQGILGAAVYVALLVAAFAVLFWRAGGAPARVALAACFAALVLHTWAYADFLEDPITWTLLGIGVALARQAQRFAGDARSAGVLSHSGA